jgi:uncharacterized protein YggE
MKIFAGCVLAFVSLLAVSASADGLPTAPYIQVSGRGELQVAPDMAYVSLTVEQTAMDAKSARADVEARTAKVIALARRLGIADKDIDAPSVTVQPQYQWVKNDSGGSRKLVGQHVSRSVTLTLRDLSRYGDLVDGLFQAGVTDLGNVQTDRSDRHALEQKARALAVADARDRAAGLAQSAGVNLGSVYSIAEQGGGFTPQPMRMYAASIAAAAPAPEYLNGKIQINADVTVFYLIDK